MIRNSINFARTLRSDFFKKRLESILSNPGYRLREQRHSRDFTRVGSRREIAEHCGFFYFRFFAFRDLHSKKLFMDNLTAAVHNPGTVKIDPNRVFVLQGIITGALSENL
jgi:hypothetical protein